MIRLNGLNLCFLPIRRLQLGRCGTISNPVAAVSMPRGITPLRRPRALPNKLGQMTPTTYHLRHVLYKELQNATESWNRSGLDFYMEVDENVPETLSWPDTCPHINFSSALDWIIKSALKPGERKGGQILVVCKLASRRSTDQAIEVEVSIQGDALGFTPDDIERITRAGDDLDWWVMCLRASFFILLKLYDRLESAAFPSCLQDPSGPDHPGHMDCLSDRAFSLAFYGLITGGGRLWVEMSAGQDTRATFAFPWTLNVPTVSLEDARSSLAAHSGSEVLLVTRSYDLTNEDTPSNILADLGFTVFHARRECELDRIKRTTTEHVKTVITTSPDLVSYYSDCHFTLLESIAILTPLRSKSFTTSHISKTDRSFSWLSLTFPASNLMENLTARLQLELKSITRLNGVCTH